MWRATAASSSEGLISLGDHQPAISPRLIIAKTNDQEGLARKFPLQVSDEAGVVLCAHGLPADIFVDLRLIAGRSPIRRQLRTKSRVPGKVIGRRVNKNEKRRTIALALDQIQRLVVIEMVRLHVARAHFFRVDEPIDAGRRLKSPRAEKRAVGRIEREGFISATAQRLRQSALDAIGGQTCEKKFMPPI